MKLIRQSEVYLMEEAVTDTIIKGAAQRIDSLNQGAHQNGGSIAGGQQEEAFDSSAARDAYGSGAGVVNIQSYVKENQYRTAAATNPTIHNSAGSEQWQHHNERQASTAGLQT